MKRIFLTLTVLMALTAALLPAQSGDPEQWLAAAQPAPPRPPMHAPPPPQAMLGMPLIPGGSYLGIGITEIDAERAKALKLPEERGIEITRVDEDTPAAKAGLKKGDVVLEFNGQRVEGAEQFQRLVRETPVGRQVKLLIHREGATQTITATVGPRKAQTFRWEGDFRKGMEKLQENLKGFQEFHFQMPDVPRAMMSWRSGSLGVEAEALSSQLAEFFGVKAGVLVRMVTKGSAAEKAGIKAGDVIVKVDTEKVSTPGEVTGAIRSARSKKTFPLTVVRNRQEMTLNVTIEEPEPAPGFSPRPRMIQSPRATPRPDRFVTPSMRARSL
jgi:serine protease Do